MPIPSKHIVYLHAMAVLIAVIAGSQSTLLQAQAAKVKPGEADSSTGWSIAAPGKVEPNNGEIRLNVEIVGRVVGVPVSLRQVVAKGEVLVRLEDTDALARIHSTEAEVQIRERNRDNVAATRRGRRRRDAADGLAEAEANLFTARRKLDRLYDKSDGTKPIASELQAASKTVSDAKDVRDASYQELQDINAESETPLYSRSESALELARAQHALALQAYEKTRLRAPSDGTILRINVRKGEVIVPAAPLPAIVLGDISKLRIRAEVDERSIADVKQGQKATIRSVAYEGQDFKGVVSEISASLGPGRIGKRQLTGPSNANVLEVILDVDGKTPLLSGMEVDVLFDGNPEADDTQKRAEK